MEINKLKCYEVDEDYSIVTAISLVDSPAVETNFLYLSEQKPYYIQLETDEKRMVYGCALRADYPIYRRYDDEEFYIKFSKECIERLSKDYLKRGMQFNWTVDHEEDAMNLTLVESWIKVDAEKDKSIALGLDDVAVGSWFIGCSVDDDETWQAIKEGRWHGFSIEAQVILDKQIQNTIMNKEQFETIEVNESFWDKVKAIIADALGKKDEPEAEVVEEAVAEIQDEVVVEEATEEVVEMAEEPVVEEPQEEDELAKLKEENEALKAEIEDLKRQLEEKGANEAELNKQIEKLSKQPSVEPIKVEASKSTSSPSFLDYASGRIKY